MYYIEGNTSKWEVVIGLEVHAQILSKNKLFSDAPCDHRKEPNTSVTLFDAAMPGVLPVLNFNCIEKAVKAGLGLQGKINLYSVFERKHYFYPDLPHGYQITQNTYPLITGGCVRIKNPEKVIRIHHIHIEQDAGKSIHDLSPDKTYIDLNRAGVPLMEIVSEPDIRSPAEAVAYVNKLKLILQCVGASNANMEKGELRCDVNVSVRKLGEEKMGNRCEIKNLNSTKSLAQAIEYEARRQVEILESGGSIEVETKLFDVNNLNTRAIRSKESVMDYRYFPDPDLLPLVLEEEYIEKIKSFLPELPDAREERYVNDLKLPTYDAEVIVSNVRASHYFDCLLEMGHAAKLAARWLTVELFGLLNKNNISFEDNKITPEILGELLTLVVDEEISERTAKEVLAKSLDGVSSPKEIVKRDGLQQITDQNIILGHVETVLNENPDKLQEYLSGRDKILGFFVGQIIKRSNGNASPHVVNKILMQEIAKRR
ncbi:aspartyl/glutamyl-tRNA(Asn/Gln) amidotransferase, B subunit [Neorickettsia helminthoeca str. Oregon]|uniref:Aspartyl/glutamyl-tRNA(Asn/Gln) amidotransferase subunit B n=1 Tax=Neorickettsia helminthoeca str. Oregon TaxID=1286528 RepID=X5HJ30_9RICK|nr:Asp-tRNA(Asn)/Glu-tRNA(Gln) amidotransferase subunit GatB [Neorickettsia helminthoeca]AHX11059.1 aspartyl/glutamyl-tRNA(Asn/Gln) amidotransferase, B subunit [Neorickettsia helminthoeca str. Oregon]